MWAPFERQKIEVHIFETANLSGLGVWKFTAKEDLNQRKQVFLHNFGPWPTHKPKMWSIFYGQKVYIRKFCSVKARGFWFKNWYFLSFACCS